MLILLIAGGWVWFTATTTDNVHLARAAEADGGAWREQFKATAADAGAGYYFGTAVAIDGNTALIGAWGDEGSSGLLHQDTGAAFIFERSTPDSNDWQQVAKLTASDAQAADNFGTSVALDGDVALVGAHQEDGGPGDPLPNAGAVYVYQRDHGAPDAWGEVAKLTPGDTAAGDSFGYSLALDNDTALIGAWLKDKDSDLVATGAAYIFRRDHGGPDAWGQAAKFTGAQRYGHFGGSVALDGHTALITADNEDEGNGAGYIFQNNPDELTIWEQVARVTPDPSGGNARFGMGAALDGDTALLGAYNDSEGANNAGAAYIFQRDWGGAGAWGQVARLIANDAQSEDWFGMDVALDQDLALVGAYREDGEGPYDPHRDFGAAYVFRRDQDGPDAWGQTAKLTAADATTDARFGWAVALHGDTVLIGAERAGDGQGAAYWFQPSQNANLSLTKTALPTTPLLPGQPLTYTVQFTNAGNDVATGVVITDAMPGPVTNVSYLSSGVPLTNTATSPHLSWAVADLAPGAGGTITLTGAVSPLLSAGAVLTNVAGISSTAAEELDDNSDSAALTVSVPRVSFDAANYTVAEDTAQGAATITVTLDAPNPFAPVTVPYQTEDGTAVAGHDYVASAGEVTIAAGQSTDSFRVPIIDNVVAGDDRYLWLTLGDAQGAMPGDTTRASLTIVQDDHAAISVRPTELVVGEGLSAASYTLKLETEPTDTVTVTVLADSQLKATPDRLEFDITNWHVNQSVRVTTVDDGEAEGAHSGQITHLSTSRDPEYDELDIPGVTVFIDDNDYYHAYLPLIQSGP
ncbi:MAG: Calx-beta domain-containing protein [Chloroflexota bacterium]